MADTITHVTPDVLQSIKAEMTLRCTSEVFVLFALGSQYDHLILMSAAKKGAFVLVADPATVTADDVKLINPTGIILSGGPGSVEYEPPPFDTAILDLGIPTFGICLGFQIWAKHIGVEVRAGERSEVGVFKMKVVSKSLLFDRLPAISKVLQSHGDEISSGGPKGYVVHGFCESPDGTYERGMVAAASYRHLHGVQFHPETTDTEFGPEMFDNFIRVVCGAKDFFPAQDHAAREIKNIQDKLGDDGKLLILLSGGCDSSICAKLVELAHLGPGRVRGLYIRGVDRPDDEANVMRHFAGKDWIDIKTVDATDRFLERLRGKIRMSDKRDAMIGVYEEIVNEEGDLFCATHVMQGTLYTDIVESGGGHQSGARKARIKRHHNTGAKIRLPQIWPLEKMVKDSARDVGRAIGVHEELLYRHPFPGPGLIVRIIGEITREKLVKARALDSIYIEELRRAGQYTLVWQAGVVITDSTHTKSAGDDAGEGVIVMYWAVWSVDGFTARAAELPHELHERIARRFGNEVQGIGAVSYRYSNKPYSTIEAG